MEIRSVILILAITAAHVSCDHRNDGADNKTSAEETSANEAVLGLWKTGDSEWMTMNFKPGGEVQCETFHGDSFTWHWRRVPGVVYKFESKDDTLGGFHAFRSYETAPQPEEDGAWAPHPNAAQYQLWSDGVPEAEWLPPITVEGDQLQYHGGDYFDYYKRVKQSAE